MGWQHGPLPPPPEGLTEASVRAWDAWLRGWFAAFWQPEDLPALTLVIRLYDLVERGTASAAVRAELRLWLDNVGISPKGQQDRRWTRQAALPAATPRGTSPYAHLRLVTEKGSAK